jgi:hypothetical protein
MHWALENGNLADANIDFAKSELTVKGATSITAFENHHHEPAPQRPTSHN